MTTDTTQHLIGAIATHPHARDNGITEAAGFLIPTVDLLVTLLAHSLTDVHDASAGQTPWTCLPQNISLTHPRHPGDQAPWHSPSTSAYSIRTPTCP